MRKGLSAFVALLLVFAMVFTMTACGKKEEEPEEEAVMSQEVAEGPVVIRSEDDIDADKNDIPLQISSITLFEDGTLLVVPTDDLRKNEMKDDEEAEGIYPFADSGKKGKVQDFYVVYFGNAGYRTIIALMDDGTLSAINGRALVEDHIIAVMNNVAGREDFTGVENVIDEDGLSIVGYTEDDEEVILDFILNFDE